MSEGWKCPHCGKAHGPHVDTCPANSCGPGMPEEEFQAVLQWQAEGNASLKPRDFPDLPPALDRRGH